MKTEEKNSSPKVRIAVLGNMNVGKSGELHTQKYSLPNSVLTRTKKWLIKIDCYQVG